MPRTRLTEAKIKTLTTTNAQEDFFHERTPNAGIRVSRNGRRTWFLFYRNAGGILRRQLLGEHPSGKRGQERYLCLKEFEAEYDILRGDLRRGIEPSLSGQRRAATQQEGTVAVRLPSPSWMGRVLPQGYPEGSMAHLLVLYFEWCVRKERLGTRTLLKYQQTANRHILPTLGGIQVSHLTHDHVREVIREKADPTVRDIKKVFSNAFNFGLNEHLRFMRGLSNPFPQTLKLTSKADDRWFRDEELRRLVAAIESLADRDAADLYTLMLLTGCRTDEVVRAQSEDVILMNGERVWLFPSKTGNDFLIPLVGRVGEILNRKCLEVGGKGFLFWPKANRSKYAWPLTKANTVVRGLSGIPDFTPYAFRHTLRTHLSALRVPHEVKEACLNHAKKGVVKHYDHWTYWEERKEALALWYAKLQKIQGHSMEKVA